MDRRSFLSQSATLMAITSATVMMPASLAHASGGASNKAWDDAVRAELATHAAYEKYHAETLTPIYAQHDRKAISWDEMHAGEDVFNELVWTHLKALKALLATPAPTTAALLYKIQRGQADEIFSCGDSSPKAIEHIASDLRRFVKGGAA
jgi:hypothetical protein